MQEPVVTDQTLYVKGAIETLLFVSEKPMTLDQMKSVLETVAITDIKNVILSLQKEYEDEERGMTLVEIAGGFQMMSNPQYAQYLRNFYKTRHKEKLSKPALETLAIIAYKQPVTRSDVELIRGVNSDAVVAHLSDKELVKVVGRKDIPGRPFIYGTTKQFLEYFGLKSLEDLPRLEEFLSLVPQDQTVEDQNLSQNKTEVVGVAAQAIPVENSKEEQSYESGSGEAAQKN